MSRGFEVGVSKDFIGVDTREDLRRNKILRLKFGTLRSSPVDPISLVTRTTVSVLVDNQSFLSVVCVFYGLFESGVRLVGDDTR